MSRRRTLMLVVRHLQYRRDLVSRKFIQLVLVNTRYTSRRRKMLLFVNLQEICLISSRILILSIVSILIRIRISGRDSLFISRDRSNLFHLGVKLQGFRNWRKNLLKDKNRMLKLRSRLKLRQWCRCVYRRCSWMKSVNLKRVRVFWGFQRWLHQ